MTETKMIWKVRSVKGYAEAHSHLIVGEVVEQNSVWLKISGRTFHFGKAVIQRDDIKVGPFETRILPWSRIEIINELPSDFNYIDAALMIDTDGGAVLKDLNQGYICPVSVSYERNY